jgi:hypothetical protein
MTPQRLLRSVARLLPLFLLSLALPHSVLGQSAVPGPSELAPEARARLAQAAEDTLLAPWQRDLMLRMAHTGTTSTLDSSVAAVRAALPALASGAGAGEWNRLVGLARFGQGAIYDPLRDRIVVFGGYDESHLNDVWTLSLAGTPAWTLLTPSGTPPSARYGHTTIYDPVRDRMVVFGGSGSGYLNDVWALSLAGSPAWTQLMPSGTPPSARAYHTAIYDPIRDRIVVFGGAGSDYLFDVWALSLAGTPAWTRLNPSGTPPSARAHHSAIYDPVRDRMVVFGGGYYSTFGSWTYFNDVRALSLADTLAWTQLTPSGTPPSGRWGHSAIYDPVRDRMVVFGGYGGSYLNDVRALSLAGTPAWTQLAPTGTPPSTRHSPSAIYDPVRDRMVVFGGTAGSILGDTWALSLAGTPVWTQPTPSGASPSPRDGHSAVYDPVRDRMIVFGGYSGTHVYLNDVWALSLAGTPVWTQLIPLGTPPSTREFHSAIYDPVRDRMVVFGGTGNSGDCNDVWALSLTGAPAWAQLTPSGTPPGVRFAQCAIYDPVRDRMVVFGGANLSAYLNEVWALSLAGTPAWTQLTPSGTPPNGRYHHSLIYDPLRDRIVVFGGYGGSAGYFNDAWALSLAGASVWTQLTPLGTPPSTRYFHSAIYDPLRDRMAVFGGSGPFLNDVWALTLADTLAWKELAPSGTPPCRRGSHSAIYDPVRDQMVVFGGYWDFKLDDAWALGWKFNTAVDDPAAHPLVSGLRPPAPNPTRGSTSVSFALAQAGRVQLGVYDVSGRLVRKLVDGERRAGSETVVWNGTTDSGAKLEAGVYFVRLAGPGLRETRRAILLR